jgi:acid phosphatase type 7
MADVLENAIRDTGRVPNLALSGHVHDYQRIEQTIGPDGPTPFVVCGNGGYHNLHAIHSPDGAAAAGGAVLKYSTDKNWGFLTLTMDAKQISGISTEIDRTGTVSGKGDKFSYSAAPVVLQNPKNVPTL